MEQMVTADAQSAAQSPPWQRTTYDLNSVCTDEDGDRLEHGRRNYILSRVCEGRTAHHLAANFILEFFLKGLAGVAAGQGVYPAKLASTVSEESPPRSVSQLLHRELTRTAVSAAITHQIHSLASFFFLGHTARQAFHGTPKQAAELDTEGEETENSLCLNTTADTLP